MTEPIELERRIAGARERVFAALHEPRDLERWAWGSLGHDVRAEVDFRVGGVFKISTLRADGARWAMGNVLDALATLVEADSAQIIDVDGGGAAGV